MSRRVVKGRHGRGDEAPEDSIRGHEQTPEEGYKRRSERNSSRRGRDPLLPPRVSSVRPLDVAVDEMDGAGGGGEPCGDHSRRVLGQGSEAHGHPVSPQGSDSGRAREGDEIRRHEQLRIAPEEGQCEDKQRRQHPAPTLIERRASDAKESRQSGDEYRGPEHDVETERPAVEQDVGPDPEHDSRSDGVNGYPRGTIHPGF